jgi:hypothetical protein
VAMLTLIWHSLIEQYRKGFALFVVGPIVLVLIVIPEFAQHIVEIQIGMFDSRQAAKALSSDSTRMAFGYVKIAGLVLTFFAAARFWWTRENGGKWWDLRQMRWANFLIGAALFVGIGMLAEPFKAYLTATPFMLLQIFFSLLSLPMLFYALSGLFGDASLTIKQAMTRSWAYLPLLLILLGAGFAPAQILHGMNHGWALMIFDSLVVGLLASLVGSAMYVAYAAFQRRPYKETK